jgi:hypothetical protein
MAACVLQASRDLGRHDISGNPNDEQIAEASIKNQFGGHPRIATTKDRRVGMLARCEICEDFLLHGRKVCRAGDESCVPGLEPLQGVLG